MKILHPDKSEYVPIGDLMEYYQGNYYCILSQKAKQRIDRFLEAFEIWRESQKIFDKNLYPDLPFSIDSPTWHARVHDIKIINSLLQNQQNLSILDLGCWNGWLCNYYALRGHSMVGVDIFTDEFDGLNACKHYASEFLLLQLPLEEIFRIQHQFDMIIFNRCWAYVSKPETIIQHAKHILQPNGKILFTGLGFYLDSTQVKANIENIQQIYSSRFGEPLFLNPSKGYLDGNDIKFFNEHKVILKAYDPLKNLVKKYLVRSKPLIQYGIYQN